MVHSATRGCVCVCVCVCELSSSFLICTPSSHQRRSSRWCLSVFVVPLYACADVRPDALLFRLPISQASTPTTARAPLPLPPPPPRGVFLAPSPTLRQRTRYNEKESKKKNRVAPHRVHARVCIHTATHAPPPPPLLPPLTSPLQPFLLLTPSPLRPVAVHMYRQAGEWHGNVTSEDQQTRKEKTECQDGCQRGRRDASSNTILTVSLLAGAVVRLPHPDTRSIAVIAERGKRRKGRQCRSVSME